MPSSIRSTLRFNDKGIDGAEDERERESQGDVVGGCGDGERERERN